MKLRVGLVGLGTAWETRHRPALRALSDRFEVRAVCDQVQLRAQQVAREFSAVALDGYQALARRSDIDALLLLAPQWYGALPILAGCEAGKAVYCTAAVGLSPTEVTALRQRVEESGIAFMTEFVRRLAPATIRLKELIATRLGKPRLLFCHARVPAEQPTSGLAALEGFSAAQQVAELVDWCSYVVAAAPTSVFGLRHGASTDPAQSDYQMMNLDFSPSGQLGLGATAQISCGRYMPAAWQEAMAYRPPAALQVACEHGIAFIDLPATLVWFDGAGRHQESLDSERPVGEQLLGQFYRAVTSLVRNPASLEEAARAVRIVQLARDSHDQGVRLPID